jgi:hypothetical protein
MSFPFDLDEVVTGTNNGIIPREYGMNFATGQLTGDIVEGADAIKIWIYLALKTTRYRYEIYSWDYGNELEGLIGQSYSKEFLEIECRRMVEDCLLINDNIESISDFQVTLQNDRLRIAFTANTKFGEVKIDV